MTHAELVALWRTEQISDTEYCERSAALVEAEILAEFGPPGRPQFCEVADERD